MGATEAGFGRGLKMLSADRAREMGRGGSGGGGWLYVLSREMGRDSRARIDWLSDFRRRGAVSLDCSIVISQSTTVGPSRDAADSREAPSTGVARRNCRCQEPNAVGIAQSSTRWASLQRSGVGRRRGGGRKNGNARKQLELWKVTQFSLAPPDAKPHPPLHLHKGCTWEKEASALSLHCGSRSGSLSYPCLHSSSSSAGNDAVSSHHSLSVRAEAALSDLIPRLRLHAGWTQASEQSHM